MVSELRLTLLILGAVFIAALAWWERRRPRQASRAIERTSARELAPDNPPRVVREPPLTLPEVHPREPLVTRELPVVEVAPDAGEPVLEPPAHDRLVCPASADEALMEAAVSADLLETAAVSAAAMPSAATAPAEAPLGDTPLAGAPPAAASRASAASVPAHPREILPELPAAAPLVVDWPSEQDRRILALRLKAAAPERFAGRSLRQALAAEGFLLGQFAIFHKPDEERRAVLSAASLTPPGTFDMDTMDSQHYGGLSLFAVLPGPKSPPKAFDELVFTARNLNERLHGVLQDEQGAPLTPARIAQLREQLHAGTVS